MDLKGRMSFMNMQSEASYYGCCVCKHQFQEGLRKKCHFTGARRFLPMYNTLRNTRTHRNHHFVGEERRGPPACTYICSQYHRDDVIYSFIHFCLSDSFTLSHDACMSSANNKIGYGGMCVVGVNARSEALYGPQRKTSGSINAQFQLAKRAPTRSHA